MADEQGTPRVNSSHLSEYIGRTVRLVCKVERTKGDVAIVRATDNGQVEVRMSKEGEIKDPYAEVIGTVEDANVIKLKGCVDLGSTELDMQLIDDCIEMTLDPRFSHIF